MPPVSTVNVELSKETLDTMLDGLGKIRDQLSSVANKWKPNRYVQEITEKLAGLPWNFNDKIQGYFKDHFIIFKDIKRWRKWPCCMVAPILEISARYITLSVEFNDFKDHHLLISRTFQGSSKFLEKNSRTFKDWHKIQGFFQECGNPVHSGNNTTI